MQDYTAMAEVELIALSRPGSIETWQERQTARRAAGELLGRQYDWITRLCLFEIGEHSLALDCVQEIMLEAAKSLKHFDGRSQLKTWLFTIARRRVIRFKRRERRRLALLVDVRRGPAVEPSSGAEALLIVSEKNRRLLVLVRQLPRQQRHAVLFHYFEDLSVEETARRLGCSAGAVKAHLSRARRKLERQLAAGK